MMTLYYDVETTGLPRDDLPPAHPDQPHVVQVAATLMDTGAGRARGSINLIVRPGIPIPDRVAKIHGITTELAQAVGVQPETAMRALIGLWRGAQVRIGHNEAFDARMVSIELARLCGQTFPTAVAELWDKGPAACTMGLARGIMDLPPTDRMIAKGVDGPKNPSLAEAYRFFVGRDLSGAHDAAVDVDACIAIHKAIQECPAERAAS